MVRQERRLFGREKGYKRQIDLITVFLGKSLSPTSVHLVDGKGMKGID